MLICINLISSPTVNVVCVLDGLYGIVATARRPDYMRSRRLRIGLHDRTEMQLC